MENILVTYESNSKLLEVPSSLVEFKNEIYSKFLIDQSVDIIIQYYNENWSEFIDVTKYEDINAGKKYRILTNIPKVLYIETESPVNNKVTKSPEKSTNLAYNTVHELPESFQSSVVHSNAIFRIPVEDFSTHLRQSLVDKKPLSRTLRSQFLYSICTSINEKYPSSLLMTDMARSIIRDYPFLKESIGTGYGGWRQAIRDKFKNMRRFDDSEEVRRRKKPNKENHRDEVLQDKQYQVELEVEQMDVAQQLNLTFEIRRNEIVQQKIQLLELKLKYPDLFTKSQFAQEFFRITNKSDLYECFPKFLAKYRKGLNNLIIRRKMPLWVESVKSLLEESVTTNEVIEEEFLLITMPVHFSEETMILTYPTSTTTDELKKEGYHPSPHIGIIGSETNKRKYFVLAEYQIIIESHSLIEAMSSLMASYFIFHCEYPKKWKSTLSFIETVIFEIQLGNKKLPSKYVNFVQKLENV